MDVSLLNKKQYQLTDKISVVIPTLKEIKKDDLNTGKCTNESNYYSILNLFFTTPANCVASLHQLGIDFTEISDFKLFLLLYNVTDKNIMREVSPLMFKNFNFADFNIAENKQTKKIVLYNEKDDIEINEIMYKWLSTIFCTMHLYTKSRPIIPANKVAKDFVIERALKKATFKKKQNKSMLDNLILALVNNCNFKYNFKTVYELSVYDFNASARQIIKKYQVDNLYNGIYSGCIDSSKIKSNNLDWLSLDYSTVEKKQR